jgi:hypothetical protein
MKKRGRRSAAEYEVPVIDVRRCRLQPPPQLGKDEAQRFADLVDSCDPAHFALSDLPLICRYVEADVLAERAAQELRDGGPVIGGKPNAWLFVQEKAVRALVAISMRLRLSPQSRLDPKTAARRQNNPPSRAKPWTF